MSSQAQVDLMKNSHLPWIPFLVEGVSNPIRAQSEAVENSKVSPRRREPLLGLVVMNNNEDEKVQDGVDTAEAAVEELDYCCKYCTKRFYSKQALGGHQNAHRMERAVEKTAKKVGGRFMDVRNFGGDPFSPVSTLPSSLQSQFPGGSGGQISFYHDLLISHQLASSKRRPPLPATVPPRHYTVPFPPTEKRPVFPRMQNPHFTCTQGLPPATMVVASTSTMKSHVSPMHGYVKVVNSNRRNQESKDVELDLTLKL